jgi:pyruvate/2-oxoglutarate dehydrogenase complex dihydrolipoamide dehydrogenase (E3) component
VVARIARAESAEVLRRGAGIHVVQARARFSAPRTVEAQGQRLAAPNVVLATGSAPIVPGLPGLSDVDPLTNETIFDLEQVPASLAVLGGGPVGVELAQAFARFGVNVTVVEAAPRLVSRGEPEASQVVETVLRRDGVVVRTGVQVTGARREGGDVVLTTSNGEVRAERLLVAVGRRPSTADLGLQTVGVAVDDAGAVVTDDRLRTTAAGVYAAGDVTGRMAFTHAAYAMGTLAAGNALGTVPGSFDTRAVPWVTFTAPEVAQVGLTEAEAARQHPGARVATYPMRELDRAIVAGQEDGFVKLVCAPRGGRLVPARLGWAGGGEVVGATIVAPRAGEMIHEVALAMRTRAFTGRLAQTVHAYPTWSMAIQQTAAQFFGGYGGRAPRPARSD